MIVSFSETLTWDTCKRQYYYGNVLGLLPKQLPEALNTGINGHSLLQTYYEGLMNNLSKEEARIVVQHKAKKILDTHATYDPSITDVVKAWSLVDNFIKDFDPPGKVALVENRFLVPLSLYADPDDPVADVQIGFTPDVVFERTGGFYTIEDSKFVGRMWSQKKINRFPQAKLYEIFLREIGYNVTQSSIRFFNTDTNKITVHKDTMTPQEPSILMRDFISTVKEIVAYKYHLSFEETRRTMNYQNCQYCWFEQPCTLEAQGKSATNSLRYLYRKNDYDYNA